MGFYKRIDTILNWTGSISVWFLGHWDHQQEHAYICISFFPGRAEQYPKDLESEVERGWREGV